MTTIDIDSTITQAGQTAYLDGALYTLFVPGAVGAPDLPTHYIQAIADDGTATAYITTETAPATDAKTITATFDVMTYDIGLQEATATTDSNATTEIEFNLSALVRAWPVSKILDHTEKAQARILDEFRV